MSQTTTPSGDLLEMLDALCAQLPTFREDSPPMSLTVQLKAARERDCEAIRTAVAALIARNAELEAERDAGKFRSTNRDVVLSDPRPLAERLPSYARQFGNETIFARTIAALLLEAHAALADRDALAAENKELRRQLAPIDKAVAQWVAEGSVYWNLPMIPKDVRDALARTPATGADA